MFRPLTGRTLSRSLAWVTFRPRGDIHEFNASTDFWRWISPKKEDNSSPNMFGSDPRGEGPVMSSYLQHAYLNYNTYFFIANYISDLRTLCTKRKNGFCEGGAIQKESFDTLQKRIESRVKENPEMIKKLDPATREYVLELITKRADSLIENLDALIQQGETLVSILMKVPVVGNDPIKSVDSFLDYIPLSLLGPGFDYVKQVDEYRSCVTIEVRKCFFNDYFAKRDRKFLTSVACSWYQLFGKNVDEERHQLRFERLSCMCQGDKSCTYLLKRMSRLEDMEMCGTGLL